MRHVWSWLVVVAAVAAAPGVAASQAPSDRQSERLAGPVREVRGEAWTVRPVDAGSVLQDGRRRPIDTVTFDAAGRVATRDIIDDYGFPVGRQTHRHEGGRLVEVTLRDPKGALIERRAYSYTTGDSPSAVSITDARGLSYEERYARGPGGRLERTTYVEKGTAVGRTVYTYATGPNPIAVAFYTARNAPAIAPVGPCLGAHRITFRYDAGHVQEQALFELDGSRKQRSTFRYDSAGNIAQEVRTVSYGELRFDHAYEYDARGNWITRTTTTNRDTRGVGPEHSTSVQMTRRTITYY